MNSGQWLRINTDLLIDSGIETARLDALILLEDCIDKNRAHVLAYPEIELTNEQIAELDGQIKRRTSHEPLAYIRGKSEFYGREFVVNQNVLVPRPESETIISLLLKLNPSEHNSIVDAGTGSGALAISAKLLLPNSSIYGTDIDSQCLEVARMNAQRLGVEVAFVEGDLLEPVANIVNNDTVLLCNLPYVPAAYPINAAANHEPSLAIFGGNDGLQFYRLLFDQLDALARKPHYILTESLTFQHKSLAEVASLHGYSVEDTSDLIQVFELQTAITSRS